MSAVTLALVVSTADPEAQADTLDAFNRTAVSLALRGIKVHTVAEPAEVDG